MKDFVCKVCGYVHEGDTTPLMMAKDEARHGQDFQGLFNRYFKK